MVNQYKSLAYHFHLTRVKEVVGLEDHHDHVDTEDHADDFAEHSHIEHINIHISENE